MGLPKVTQELLFRFSNFDRGLWDCTEWISSIIKKVGDLGTEPQRQFFIILSDFGTNQVPTVIMEIL